MPSYREFAPPPQLADSVECLWVMRHSEGPAVQHRVLPDGCADILFTVGTGKSTLEFVGTMTQFQDFQLLPGQLHVGLRFHPGMWADAGGLIVKDAFPFPGGRRFHFADPSGNELAVWSEK